MLVYVKLPDGSTVTVEAAPDTTLKTLRLAVASNAELPAASCRLIFAGTELTDDDLSVASAHLAAESEVHLLLRERDTVREPFRGKDSLQDYIVQQRVGGKNPGAATGVGYSLNGVCSYVYRAQLRGGAGEPIALKVMINVTGGSQSQAVRFQPLCAASHYCGNRSIVVPA